MSYFRKALGLRSGTASEQRDEKKTEIVTKPSDEKVVPSVVHALNDTFDFEGPPMLARGGTRLRTPYEIHGYQFVGRLTEKPPGPLYLAVRSGAAVWSSQSPAIIETVEDSKKRTCLIWKSERLSLRIMHPSQELVVELVTRKGDFEQNVFGEGVLKGINMHPEIGAERKASIKLHRPINRRNSIANNTSPQQRKPTKVGFLGMKVYYASPDDFVVTVVDAISFKDHQAVAVKKLNDDIKRASLKHMNNPLPLLSEEETIEENRVNSFAETSVPSSIVEELSAIRQSEGAGEIDREEDHLLGTELVREFKAAGGSARDLTMSGSALSRRAELLLTAAKSLEDKGLVGANVKQSLDHLLALVKEETVRSGAFFAWIEDLMWDLSQLCGKEGGDVFTAVYGRVLEYPILPRPMDSLIDELPAIKGMDLRALTFGLNSDDRCIVLRATSVADYVRWTAAIATYLDPLNRGRDAPRYCRIGCADEKYDISCSPCFYMLFPC
jgi:hypothetical protein